jgi:hypothetical protein
MYLFSGGGGGTFDVICDNTNQTSTTTLIVTINLTLPSYIGTITLNVVNTADQTTITTVTV